MFIRGSVLAALVMTIATASLRAEWGNGYGYECKNKNLSGGQQSGWNCGNEISSLDSLKKSFSNAKVEKVGNEIKITFADKVFFESNSATLNSAAEQEIQAVSNWLKKHPGRKVRVEGHTDSAGQPDYNKQLSQQRAEVVANAIKGKGVAERRIQFLGYGETHPVAANDSEEGRQANRRVEIFVNN